MKANLKKVYWITPYYFVDVDLALMRYINKGFDLYWIIINPVDKQRYSSQFLKDYAQKNDISVKIYEPSGRQRSLSQLLMDLKLLFRVITVKKHLLYTEYMNIYFIVPLKFLYNRNKIIIGIHDVIEHSNFIRNKFLIWTNEFTKKSFIHYQVFSNLQADIFYSNYKRIPTAIDLSLKDFGTPSVSVATKVDKTHFLFFGSIEFYKNLELLISACEKLVELGYNNFELTIAGRGEYWQTVQRKIAHNNKYNLQIRFILNEEIPNLFSSSHFLILPYRDVTQSGPLLISYQYSIPMIVSDIRGFTDYVEDGIDGYIFENDNLDSLLSVLQKAIQLDEISYSALQSKVKEKSLKFAPSVISSKYISLFNKLTM